MSFVGGSLSLKGGSVGVKKKKKSKDGKKSKPEKDVASAPDQTEAEQVTASKEPAAPSVHKTKAQLQHEEYVAKREADMLKKAGVKSHRQRISEYNEKLSQMTEHNDIPKHNPKGMPR